MKQKQKQKLVSNQIQAIRNSIKGLNQLLSNGMYLDRKQRNAIGCIAAYDFDRVLLGR
jgi:hypothetical protein